jgi:hypothetical protein
MDQALDRPAYRGSSIGMEAKHGLSELRTPKQQFISPSHPTPNERLKL